LLTVHSSLGLLLAPRILFSGIDGRRNSLARETFDHSSILFKKDDNPIPSDHIFLFTHYTEATEEGVIWEVHAESAQYRKKDNLALLKNPKITLTMPDGRIYVLTGKEGTLKQDSKDMKLTGDVHLQSNNGNSFKTDEVTYSGREKRCHTGSPVSLKNSRMQIDATGMSISLADEHLTLLSGVKACIQR